MSFSNTATGDKPEDPYKAKNIDNEASLKEKVEGLSKFIAECKFGMLTTHHGASGTLVSRCMALASQETGGVDLLFHTNTESGKTNDIELDPHVNVSFLNSSGDWASIAGTSSIITDRSTIKRHYSPSLKAWLGDLGDGIHDGGPDDPRIGIIKVQAVTATYAVSGKTVIGRAAQVAQGVVTGSAPAINKLRELNEREIQTWRSSNKMVEQP